MGGEGNNVASASAALHHLDQDGRERERESLKEQDLNETRARVLDSGIVINHTADSSR